MADFRAFEQHIAVAGMVNGLAQTLLELTIPGVPDIYQGTEIWRLSLVDPDNRRPVDFAACQEMLAEVLGAADQSRVGRWLASWRDGRVKLHLTAAALRHRREHTALFTGGDYLRLDAQGEKATNIIAFARRTEAEWSITAVPRLAARLGDLTARYAN